MYKRLRFIIPLVIVLGNIFGEGQPEQPNCVINQSPGAQCTWVLVG